MSDSSKPSKPHNKNNVFRILPAGFFNPLSGGSNQEIYADCLILIYEQFEREISYRMDRKRIRDVLAAYLYDVQASLSIDDEMQTGYTELANAIIRKFSAKQTGWLEEETDDATLEKAIYMTENGLALAEFLLSIRGSQKEEYAAYIIQIYHTLTNGELWQEHPYINGIKSVLQYARALSKSLKKLSTYIRKIIERMIMEETFESLTDNLIEYFDGSFVREYARLTKQQNVYRYRGVIRTEIERKKNDDVLMQNIIRECAEEEQLSLSEAEEMAYDMFSSANRFLFDDYERIMNDIKHKINVYLQVGIGRARFLRNREVDEKNQVERTIRIITEEYGYLAGRDLLPDEMNSLFSFERNEFIDTDSVRYPGKERAIMQATEAQLEELTPGMLEEARRIQQREAFNPYSKDRMKVFFDACLGGKQQIEAEQLPIRNKEDLMATLSAVAYARDNGFLIEVQDGYVETNEMLLRRFSLKRR